MGSKEWDGKVKGLCRSPIQLLPHSKTLLNKQGSASSRPTNELLMKFLLMPGTTGTHHLNATPFLLKAFP
jgi:hypothetical protein